MTRTVTGPRRLETGFGEKTTCDTIRRWSFGTLEGGIDTANLTVGAGFTLLYLTGQIDDEGRALLTKALRVLKREYGPKAPEVGTMLADLASFR